jgi:hypothetical protein
MRSPGRRGRVRERGRSEGWVKWGIGCLDWEGKGSERKGMECYTLFDMCVC